MKLKILLLFFLTELSFPGQSQQADSAGFYTLSLEELMNIPITTASKFEQNIKEAPSTTSLITREQLLKYGWLSGAEIMYRLPGFSMSQDYERKTVSSRGIFEGWNNNHMLMLVDGVPVNDNMYGTAFTSEITPLVFARSVEVIRGPGSALYGTNATNGVISYNSLSAKDLNKKAEIRYRLGSKNTQVLDVLVGHENESVSFVSAFNYYQTNGNEYDTYDASGLPAQVSDKRSSYYFFNKIEGKGALAGFSFQHHEQSWDFNTGHGWLFYIPDKPENMNESRRLLTLKYKTPDAGKKLTQEYVVRYQLHSVNWNVRLFPDNTGGFPFGLTELLKTHTSDIFLRTQWSYSLGENSVVLGGVENSIFLYNGDDMHISNANLNTDYLQTTNNEFIDVGSYFGWIKSHPMNSTGVFTQYTSPKLWNKLQATVGARYDYSSFKFNALDVTNTPTETKSYSKLSPRVSLVYSASDNWTIKAMGGRAFRTPSPSELFGSNTYLLASNLRNLKPELITTLEVSSDLTINKWINWRLNFFETQFNDQIAYSVSNYNLSTNLFSLKTMGVENEIFFAVSSFDGFLNHSYAQRLNEEIVDSSIQISKTKLTWVPQNIINLGVKYNAQRFYFSTQTHYQGQVKRRGSDQDSSADALRGSSVNSWLSFDAKFTFKPSDHVEVGVIGTNIFNEKGYLLKNNLYSFDYRIPAQSILIDLRLMF